MVAAAVHAAAPVSFSYTGPAVAIPDAADLSGSNPGAEVGASIAVSGLAGAVAHVAMSIDGATCTNAAGATTVGIDHSFVNDLRLTLRSPAGTRVLVVNNTDGSGNNFCQVVLDDASPGPSIQSVVTANAPFTGTYTPNAPLAAFIGEAANGSWTLLAQDFFSSDTGNIRAWTVTITPQDSTTTSLSSSVNPSVPGQAVTLTATVASTGAGAMTAAVNFLDGATDLCGPVTPVAGVATCSTSSLALGTHSLTAVYAGDASNATSTSNTVSQVVALSPTSTTLASTPAAPAYAQPVSLAATVTGYAPGGTVTFTDGASTLCGNVPVVTAGNQASASCSLPQLAIGTHTLVAAYSGDASNAVSASSPLTVTVASPVVTPVPALSPASLLLLAVLLGLAVAWRRRWH